MKSKSFTIVSAITIAFLFVLSSFAAIPAGRVVAAQSSANLNTITFVDYGGSDASGVADLSAGKTDIYNFQLTPTASASLGAGFNQYVSPGSIYGIYVNPQNTTAGTGNYNPFYFQKVRFALNYLIDRTYFSQTIEGGKFVPCIAAVCAEPDQVTVSGAMAAFSNVTFNFQFANATIYKVLSAQPGITYVAGHYYHTATVEGHKTTVAVTVQLFDRIDDPIRHAFMQYLNSQLQRAGFQTAITTGTLSDAFVTVFGSAPASAGFDIYPASNSQIWGFYDSNAVNFYSAGYYEDLPASDHYGQDWVGTWDNNTQEAYSTYLYDQADKLGAVPLLNSAYTTLAQRADLLSNLTYYGVLGATYITLGTSLAPQATDTAVSGVTPNFLVDPIANYQNYVTMDVTASGAAKSAHDLKIGVRHIENGAMNPVGGDSDAYTGNVLVSNTLPLYSYGPSSGYPYSTGMTYKVNGNDATGSIPVPSSAIFFQGSSDSWVNASASAKAQNDVTVDFSKLFANTKWSDGTSVTLADLLMQYIEEGLFVTPTSSIHSTCGCSGLYNTQYPQVLGIKVLNSTALRIWTTNTFFPDANLAALAAIADVAGPLGYSSEINGGGMTPWQMYVAMNSVVANHQAAWSTSAATAEHVDWLSLTNAQDVANVKAALTAAAGAIPAELTQLQTLTGQSWVTTANAAAGYTAAIQFITTNGVAEISDGAFYISQYNPNASPASMVVTKNPNFNAAGVADPHLFAPAVVLTPQATIPPTVTPGSTITITILQTADGAASSTATPASGANVIVQLVAGGAIKFTETFKSDTSGQVKVNLPSSLPTGTYLLGIYSYSDTSSLVKPIVQSVVVVGATHTTTTTTSTSPTTSSSPTSTQTTSTPPTSTTTTSTATDYTPYIYGGIVVVIIVVIAAALARRRGGGGP